MQNHYSPHFIYDDHHLRRNGVLLADISQTDTKWDDAKLLAEEIGKLFHGTKYSSYAVRMKLCAAVLSFALKLAGDDGNLLLRLISAAFCRCPRCPICQIARGRMWRAKAFQLMPALLKEHPSARFLFLTLTVENPHITELRETLNHMSKSWARLCDLKEFPATGFVKTVEVTREYRCITESACKAAGVNKPCSRCIPTDNAHPHFHCLLMVKTTYFTGKYYLKHDDWVSLWKRSLRVDYIPSVNIKAVKNKITTQGQLHDAVMETFKYAVKLQNILTHKDDPAFMNDQAYLVELTNQLYKMRLVSTGGILKSYFKEIEKDLDSEDLIHTGLILDEDGETIKRLSAVWNEYINHYQIIDY